jgi:hypothetical protein
MLCPYCETLANEDPEIEDDFGRLMCAECFVAGLGTAIVYYVEGCRVSLDPLDPLDQPYQSS